MLENGLILCPNELWNTEAQFWYNAYHCLFYLDYYLTLEPDKFAPPSPFTLSEFDPSGAMPNQVYTKEVLLAYLQANRKKCHNLIESMTTEIAYKRWVQWLAAICFLIIR